MVQVTVKEGILEGEKLENEFGGSFYSFKGIPYAEPPVGDLRFKAPQPAKPWSGVRSAKQHGPQCYQYDIFLHTPVTGSEDCLYLNVYTPDIKPDKPLPVMVLIHGGGFVSGNSDSLMYGPELLVRHDVILVSFNYRLEVLGFLCLHTEDIPGNAGFKDQVAALRWVKNNISSFGGDPENVTIFGESAGGASVTLHLVSPMSKGLFKKAISQSGAATCAWVSSFEPRDRAIALARSLGCDSNDDKELYEFFKAQPIENLVHIKKWLTISEEFRAVKTLTFGVVSEKQFGNNERFFYGNIYDVIRKGIHEGVKVIAGYCEDEGIISLAESSDIDKIVEQANNFPEVFAPDEIVNNCPPNVMYEVGKKIKHFYYGNDKVTKENLAVWMKMKSMSMFLYGILQWQKISCCKNRVYTYSFEAKTERNWLAPILGATDLLDNKQLVCHSDDIAYLFPMKFLNLNLDQNSETFKIVDTVTKLWTNFAKVGDPTPDFSLGVEWPPFDHLNQAHLRIGNTLEKWSGCPTAGDDELGFWESIFRQYLPGYVSELDKASQLAKSS